MVVKNDTAYRDGPAVPKGMDGAADSHVTIQPSEHYAGAGGTRARASHSGVAVELDAAGTAMSEAGDKGESSHFAPAHGIPLRGGKVINRDDWLPMSEEPMGSYVYRLCTEGHTVPDAFMTCACAQIGQVMLNSPNALYKMGIVAGGISMFCFLLCGYWTIYQFMALYLEMKRRKMTDGTWWETDGKHVKVLQYFEVVGFFLGPWAMVSSVVIAVVTLFGVLMTQINACANNMYFVDPSRTKREWSLIFGGTMVFSMIIFPKFNHFRIANVLGLVTVGCMAVYIIICAVDHGWELEAVKNWPDTSQDWFNGAAIWLTILGTHAVTFETLECMEQPAHFKQSFSAAWVWAILTTVPHSILCNLAYPTLLKQLGAGADNVFALLGANNIRDIILRKPASQAKYAMAIMMIIHQFIAFALYGTSLAFVWEKLLRVHHRPWYIRIPCRLPISALVWFLAILAPFYGAINALYASLAIPYLGFVLPSIAMLHFFKSRAQLEGSVLQPYAWVRWAPAGLAARLEKVHPRLGLLVTPWFAFNIFMVLFYSGFGGTAIYYSALLVKQYYVTFGPFAKCYGCPKAPVLPKGNVTVNATNATGVLG